MPEHCDLHSIVLCLGGFHTIMSFLGSIGHIMSGCGLQDCLELLYASNAVIHMLSGKAIERAICGHFLIDATLNAMLMSKTFHLSVIDWLEDESSPNESEPQEITFLEEETHETRQLLKMLTKMHDCITEGTLPITAVQTSPDIQKFCDMLAQKNSLLISKNLKLWFQYMDMLDVLRKFLKAEKTGNWKLHLQAMHEILLYLAASGHNLYTKSVYLYLQDMVKLQQLHPKVYAHFLQGYHMIRQSNRFWAGLPLDLAIEQILMKSVKTTGGLTQGMGISEIQRLAWLFLVLLAWRLTTPYRNFLQFPTAQVTNTKRQHKQELRGI